MEAAFLTEKTAAHAIAEIIDVIGPEATERLCERLGGMKISMGRNNKRFIDAIGLDAAKKLRAYWGRGTIYVPRRATSYQARHAEMRRLRKEGNTITAIALVMRVTERQVYSVLAREEPSSRKRA